MMALPVQGRLDQKMLGFTRFDVTPSAPRVFLLVAHSCTVNLSFGFGEYPGDSLPRLRKSSSVRPQTSIGCLVFHASSEVKAFHLGSRAPDRD